MGTTSAFSLFLCTSVSLLPSFSRFVGPVPQCPQQCREGEREKRSTRRGGRGGKTKAGGTMAPSLPHRAPSSRYIFVLLPLPSLLPFLPLSPPPSSTPCFLLASIHPPFKCFSLIFVTVNSVPIVHGFHFLSQAWLYCKYSPHRR